MSKIVFSQTEEYKNMRENIVDVLATIACYAVDTKEYANIHCDTKFNEEQMDYMYERMISVAVEGACRALGNQYTEFSFGDTATRSAAEYAVHNILTLAWEQDDRDRWGFIHAYIDCSDMLNDLLHMYTCNSDIYEYEGENALFSEEF